MKRRKRRARKSRTNPKRKRRHVAKRRHARKNPRRSHRRVRRAAVRNPRRRRRHARSNPRRRRRHTVRRHMSNPRRRRHRRNPSLPLWAKGAIAVALATAGFAVVNVASFAVTQRTDPTLETAPRNRMIAAALVMAAGVALAFKSPILGIGLAAGGGIAVAGNKLTNALASLDKSGQAVAGIGNTSDNAGFIAGGGIGAYERMGAVYGQMGAYEPMGAVYGQTMGAVYGQTMGQLGGYMPPAPYAVRGPFG